MGSSFIPFRGHGFEAADGAIEVLLALMVAEIDRMDDVPAWLREARDEWNLQATAGFGFGVTPGLDRYATDDEKRKTIVDLARSVLLKLEAYGPTIPREELNALKSGGEGATFPTDPPAAPFLRTVNYFVKLLEGKLEPWETDARFSQER